MTARGIVLPVEVLSSGWFQVLAIFVAINTLIFVGLSIAKLLPKRRTRGRRTVGVSPGGPGPA